MLNTVIINGQKQDLDKNIASLMTKGDINIVAQGKDGYDALKLIGNLKPDMAILDNQLDFIEKEEIPPLLKARSPSTAIILLMTKISDHQLLRVVSSEVSALVLKETDMDLFPRILKSITEGGCFISPLLATRVLHFLSEMNRKGNGVYHTSNKLPAKTLLDNINTKFPTGNDPTSCLNKTELRILTHIGEGFTSNEIARNMDLAAGTVRNYTSTVKRKIGLRSRTQMIFYAFQYGLVPLKR